MAARTEGAAQAVVTVVVLELSLVDAAQVRLYKPSVPRLSESDGVQPA